MKQIFAIIFSLFCIQSFAYDFECDNLCFNVVSATDHTCELASKNSDKYSTSDWCPETIEIPQTVTFNGIEFKVIGISEHCFYFQSKLTHFEIPPFIEYIGSFAFAGCKNLISIKLPENLQKIGGGAFQSCEKLVNLNLPNSLTEIPWYLCKGCSSLPSITFPEGLITIRGESFEDCISLETIIFPSQFFYLERNTFKNCTFIKNIYYASSSPQSIYTNQNRTEAASFPELAYIMATLYVKDFDPFWIKYEEPWCNFQNIEKYSGDAGIEDLSIGNDSPRYYISTEGLKSSTPFKGINLIIYNSGRTEKVFMP